MQKKTAKAGFARNPIKKRVFSPQITPSEIRYAETASISPGRQIDTDIRY